MRYNNTFVDDIILLTFCNLIHLQQQKKKIKITKQGCSNSKHSEKTNMTCTKQEQEQHNITTLYL
jgi:hypothetical protein